MRMLSLYHHLAPALGPLGLPYALLMRKRRALYASGVLQSYAPRCPCVSVGNISWGGTGKTPLVGWLLRYAEEHGLKAVVLTRGYKGNVGAAPLFVREDTPPEQCGDEPLMLARAFPSAQVIAFPRRMESARLADERLAPDMVVLDDGMQHLAVRRDINLVVLRPEDLADQWNKVIPSGSWREGESALTSASAFLLKSEAAAFDWLEDGARSRLQGLDRPLFCFRMPPVGLRPLFPKHGEQGLLDPADYADRPYVLVSGVGNPALVEETARLMLHRSPVQHFDFADHHPYSGQDVQAVLKLSPAPLPVVCTAKDAVKLSAFADLWGATPVWVLETAVEFGPYLFSDKSFALWWEDAWQTALRDKAAGEAGRP